MPRRGELYWVRLDPAVGSEIAKMRPCMIISNDIGNQHSARVIVAALSTGGADRIYPFEVLLERGEGGIAERSKILLDQIRSIDKVRLGRHIGQVPSHTLAAVDDALRVSLSL